MRDDGGPLIGFFTGTDCLDAFHRVRLPAGELTRRGFEVRLVPDLESRTLSEFRTVVVHRPYSPELCRRLLAAPAQTRIVLSIDENFEGIDVAHPAYDGSLHSERMRGLLAEVIQTADEVIAANDSLRKYYGPYNSDITVIPDMIHPGFYNSSDPNTPSREGILIGCHASRGQGVIPTGLKRALSVLTGRKTGVRSVVLGGFGGSPAERCERFNEVSWTDLPWALSRLRFDIGLVPLDDTPYNRCSTSLPCLELAACGIPIVASDLSPCAGVIEHGVTGYLASTDEEWEHSIDQLIDDADARLRMGRAAFDRLLIRHSPEVIGEVYEQMARRWCMS
jgi:hypothetical protein